MLIFNKLQRCHKVNYSRFGKYGFDLDFHF